MNQFFDFTPRQLKCIAVLSGLLVVMGGYLLIRSYAFRPPDAPRLEVHLGAEQEFSGIFVLDPNTAPPDSLELLPGIGPVLADRIVRFREHTLFETEIDITNVKGIGPKLYEQIKPYLKVRRW